MITIGLDAGHGGSSSGTYSVNTTKDGLFEKDYALEMVKMINAKLVEHGFKTVLTRTADYNPGTVMERARMCIAAGCDFALSVHFNGFEKESANGTEIFVPYGETYAQIETRIKSVLTQYFKERAPFARSNSYYDRNDIFDKRLNETTKRFDAWEKQDDYFGFVRTCWKNGVSADLLEICFLTNKKDFETYIANEEAIADGIARAIVEGFGKKYKPTENKVEKIKPKIAVYGKSKDGFLNLRR